MYVFYPDVYFFSQLVTALFALAVISCVYNIALARKRLLLVAIGVAFLSTFMVIVVHPFSLYCILVHILVIPAAVYSACRPSTGKEFFRESVTSYVAIWMLYGCMEWITIQTGWSGNLLLCVSAVCLYLAVFLGARIRNHINNQIPVILCYKEKKITLTGYYDTGNMLMDPYCHKPVHVVCKEAVKPLLEAQEVFFRMIPYETVSGRELMESFIIDELILCKKKPVVIKKAVIGISKSETFKEQTYQLLLNAKQMNQ